MSKQLIIVESPTKARTLARFLGEDFRIEASMGHIRDLPKSKLGVDIEKQFEPQYVIPKDKRKTVESLKEAASKANEIILATDPDREGEAIAWHIAELIGDPKEKTQHLKRIVFHEITKEAVREAMSSPRTVDLRLVDAQVARRVLDRLMGYKLSPLLWKKIKRGLSAGRVQSVALRLIVEREREIEAFVPVEYWSIDTLFKGKRKEADKEFEALLLEKAGKKIEVKTQKEADQILKDLENASYKVGEVREKEVKKSPYPPFTTSTMTQAGSAALSFTSKKTMKLAQDLYEEGLITYHRTDSFTLSQTALNMARKFISENYSKEYLPAAARVYKTKSKSAQEAHEAIRPTNLGVLDVKSKGLGKDHQRLYDLIWKRFLASQMADSLYDQISMDILSGEYLFRAAGSVVKFPGWQAAYKDISEQEEKDKAIPILHPEEPVDLIQIVPNQHFTQPPPRYTEASLIKTLEEDGIGRPSTYSPIISTIIERRYVELEERKFKPTPIGVAVNDFLVKNFPSLISVPFTAQMEDALDKVAEGETVWNKVIENFYKEFEPKLEKVEETSDRVKVAVEKVDENCPEGHQLVVRYGPFGKFLACSKYPEHKFTKTLESSEFKEKREQIEKLGLKCPESGHSMVIKQNRRGRIFYGCSGYPKCKWASWKLEELENLPSPSEPQSS